MPQLKQALVNNAYYNKSFDSILGKFLNQCNTTQSKIIGGNHQLPGGERWAYIHFIGGAANYPIIYP